MFLTGNTSRSAPKHSVLDGRNGTVISGQDLSSDKEVPRTRRFLRLGGHLKAIIYAPRGLHVGGDLRCGGYGG